jgi:dTDP-4-amino-4,6-dideoxygalactose transaminase
MKPCIEGGKPQRREFLPFALPMISKSEIDEVIQALESGWLTVGPKTKEFQKKIAEYIGSKGAVALNSCTGAIHLSLVALDVAPGDEVVVPVLSFAAVPNAVIHCGATPIFVDIDPDTLNMEISRLPELCGPKTKALVPLYFGGLAFDIDLFKKTAADLGISVIVDAAHAFGTRWKGSLVGTEFSSTCFSFYATKNITTGEGGAVTSNDESLLREIELLSLHGMSHDSWLRYTNVGSWYYEIAAPGYKYNMSDLQAALGLAQLKRADEFRSRRTEIAKKYNEGLSDVEGLKLPADDEGHSWHLYTIWMDQPRFRIDRARFIEALSKENVGTSVHFIPMHYHPYYRKKFGFNRGDFPNAEKYFEGAISLPIYPRMSDEDVEDVISAVRKIALFYPS